MFSLLCFLVGLFIGIAARQQALITVNNKWNEGEMLVVDKLARLNRLHALINNVTLQTADGTTQIDHILVTEAGLFVIETKHYFGWIFGNPNEASWTQSIYGTKHRFQNPMRQNYGHVMALQGLFKLPETAFINLVVFTGSAGFKTNLGPNTILLDQLLGFIEQHQGKILDEKQITYVVGRIEMKRLVRSTETDEYHIDNVRRKIARRNDPLRVAIR